MSAAAFNIIIFIALFGLALSFVVPENKPDVSSSPVFEGGNIEKKPAPPRENIYVRIGRSLPEPQRSFEARGEHNSRHGQSASLNYNHPIGKNTDVYGGVSRNFRYNDNSGQVGVRYKF